MNIVFDTNVLCALLDEKDAHHKEAEHLLRTAQGAYILLPCIVIAELLASDAPGEYILRQCRNLASAILSDTEEDMITISIFSVSVRKTLKANDCLILAHAIKHNAELYTFDKRLRKAYGELRKK